MLAHELYLHDLKTVLYAPPVIIFLWGKKMHNDNYRDIL